MINALKAALRAWRLKRFSKTIPHCLFQVSQTHITKIYYILVPEEADYYTIVGLQKDRVFHHCGRPKTLFFYFFSWETDYYTILIPYETEYIF